MTPELEQTLIKEFPALFRQSSLTMQQSCMFWGCAHGDGWYQLVHDLAKELSDLQQEFPNYTLEFGQIKEKFGLLRVYVDRIPLADAPPDKDSLHDLWDKVYAITGKFETVSGTVCEECGTKDAVTRNGPGWTRTLCDTCRLNMYKKLE